MKWILVLGALFSTTAFAHELKMGPYVKLQEALAADDFSAALKAHEFICTKDLGHYRDQYPDCDKKFKDIEELRASFKSLSQVYLESGDKKEMGKYQKASCPMAKAKWIQRPGKLRNPYYGKSMLECGEKI